MSIIVNKYIHQTNKAKGHIKIIYKSDKMIAGILCKVNINKGGFCVSLLIAEGKKPCYNDRGAG